MTKQRRFINGPLKGTRLEIKPSKEATKLPNGVKIQKDTSSVSTYTPTQQAHMDGKINVHDPQSYTLEDKKARTKTTYVGPSIAQEWKILYQGKRPFYQVAFIDRVENIS